MNLLKNLSKNYLKPFAYRSLSLSTINPQSEMNRRAKNKHPLMLMDLPRILVPSLLDLIKIRLKVKFKMLQIDPSFSYSEFSKGSLQALVTVSNAISRGEFDSLKNLVYDESIEKIKQNYELLSQSQRNLVGVNQNDVQVQVHYLFQEAKTESSLFVKMGLLFYIVPGFFEAVQQSLNDPIQQFEMRKKFQNDLIVADYRFVREYSKSSQSSWLISELNHWAISDHEEELLGKK